MGVLGSLCRGDKSEEFLLARLFVLFQRLKSVPRNCPVKIKKPNHHGWRSRGHLRQLGCLYILQTLGSYERPRSFPSLAHAGFGFAISLGKKLTAAIFCL